MTGQPTPPRENVASGTHRRLLDAAATLFRRKGYAGTSTRELASLVGIQNASIYHHIRGKADLLYVLCVDSLTSITDAAEEATAQESEPVARLRALITAHLSASLADQDKHATMLMELRSLPPGKRNEVIALRDRYEAVVESVIRDAQLKGALRADIPSRQLTLALLNLLNWTIFWFRPDGVLTAHNLASAFAGVYLDGVLAPGRSRGGEEEADHGQR